MKTNNALLAALVGGMVLGSAVLSHAQSLIYGLTSTNSLVVFSSSGSVASGPIITGVGVGEEVVGIDFRPFNGELYALTADTGNTGRLYTVNPISGAASALTLVGALTNITARAGIDFNPVALAGVKIGRASCRERVLFEV